ncbi:MAG: hypothetical protein UV36_C0011G0008 [Parcubacteria group bacterium GW2011_GWC2_42_6]|nr:MAG: hypothetical protein UV36_C0011G0008 [Parcubacteria group bacterium GW2011_GWC2_42_6]KKT76355.1 MAG: hypothetical protein UW72_C0007G0002 [Parcubacteria group bacterium GW2011_GWF2_44_7]
MSIIEIIKKTIRDHKSLWPQRYFYLNAGLGFLFLLFSFFVNYAANVFVSNRASNYVSDLILDNLPVINVNFIFVEGFAMFIALAIIFLLKEPQKIPFAVKTIAVFILIRSAFIILTHLAVPPNHSFIDPGRFIQNISSGNDLFFSSHTGFPYLLALLFWKKKYLRTFFILCSMFFGFVVLLGHLHYSIDVFAAFFITYSIFCLAQKLFSRDYHLFLNHGVADKEA